MTIAPRSLHTLDIDCNAIRNIKAFAGVGAGQCEARAKSRAGSMGENDAAREKDRRGAKGEEVPPGLATTVRGARERCICRMAYLLRETRIHLAKGYLCTHTGRVSERYETQTKRRESRGGEKRQTRRRRPRRPGQGHSRGAPRSAPGAQPGRDKRGKPRREPGTESRGEPRRTSGEAAGSAPTGSAAGRPAGPRRRSPKALSWCARNTLRPHEIISATGPVALCNESAEIPEDLGLGTMYGYSTRPRDP
jgi:hypothetical protein